jgi:hypothetical protein
MSSTQASTSSAHVLCRSGPSLRKQGRARGVAEPWDLGAGPAGRGRALSWQEGPQATAASEREASSSKDAECAPHLGSGDPGAAAAAAHVHSGGAPSAVHSTAGGRCELPPAPALGAAAPWAGGGCDGRGGWLPGSTAAAAVQYEGPPAAAAPGLAGRGAWGGDGVAREGTGGRPGGRGSRNSTRLSSRWPIPSRLKSI